ncbi:MAG TPA: hypothetical protein VF666_18045 [Pyrinomonadaceae bacterium]|jgi:hypothetical protein
MSLAEDKFFEVNETDFIDASAAIEKWQHFPASFISHHGQPCCDVGREWILSMDFSLLNAGNPLTGPRWLRNKYKWGPSAWPLHWCEAAEQKTLDCGALAALSQEIFVARGVRSFPVQLIHQYSEHAASQWCKAWNSDDANPLHWIKEDLIYHEGCAVVVRDNEIKVWDATATWWINAKQFGGYGGVLAIRVIDSQSAAPGALQWGAHRIVPNQWQKLARARADFA